MGRRERGDGDRLVAACARSSRACGVRALVARATPAPPHSRARRATAGERARGTTRSPPRVARAGRGAGDGRVARGRGCGRARSGARGGAAGAVARARKDFGGSRDSLDRRRVRGDARRPDAAVAGRRERACGYARRGRGRVPARGRGRARLVADAERAISCRLRRQTGAVGGEGVRNNVGCRRGHAWMQQ